MTNFNFTPGQVYNLRKGATLQIETVEPNAFKGHTVIRTIVTTAFSRLEFRDIESTVIEFITEEGGTLAN